MSATVIHGEVLGAKELDKALGDLDVKVATKVLDKALRKAAKPLLDAARDMAPERTGALKRSIKVRKGKSRNGLRSVVIGVGDKWFLGDEFYAAFQEFGHKQGSRKLANREQVPGEHFIEHAYDEQKEAAANALIATLRALIEKVAAGGNP